MLLADMGSSELVAARIHNLKSIFYALDQLSIRSIMCVKYLGYLKSEVHDEESCPHLAVPLPLDFWVEAEVLSAAEHQTHLVHYIWHGFRGS